jgi:hypothetical protein
MGVVRFLKLLASFENPGSGFGLTTWGIGSAKTASRAVLMIVLRIIGFSIREKAFSNSKVSRVLAKQLRSSSRGGVFSNHFDGG